jgi:hypothetical protein
MDKGTWGMSKKKNKKRTVPIGRGRVLVFGGDPKMSEVILELADPLLDGDVSNAKEVDFIVQLTIAAWNKAMFPADRQAAMEKEIIDTLVPPDGKAEQVGTVIQALDIVDERRKKALPESPQVRGGLRPASVRRERRTEYPIGIHVG